MTLKLFVEKYLGRKVDVDGKFGAQCVDLYRQYCTDVVKMPNIFELPEKDKAKEVVGGAKNLYLRYDDTVIQKKYLERIPNTPNFIPMPGDIGINGDGEFGHVYIVLYANVNYMIVLEQDGYAQKGTVSTMRDYSNVLGFLRARESV